MENNTIGIVDICMYMSGTPDTFYIHHICFHGTHFGKQCNSAMFKQARSSTLKTILNSFSFHEYLLAEYDMYLFNQTRVMLE